MIIVVLDEYHGGCPCKRCCDFGVAEWERMLVVATGFCSDRGLEGRMFFLSWGVEVAVRGCGNKRGR